MIENTYQHLAKVFAGCLLISTFTHEAAIAEPNVSIPLFDNNLNQFSTLLTSSVDNFTSNSKQLGYWEYGYYDAGVFTPFPESYKIDGIWQSPWGELSAPGGKFIEFEGKQHPLVRRWVSNFNGTVNLEGKFSLEQSGAELSNIDISIYVDGEKQATQFFVEEGSIEAKYQLNVRVNQGTVIEFVARNEDGWEGKFNFETDIYVPPGLIFTTASEQIFAENQPPSYVDFGECFETLSNLDDPCIPLDKNILQDFYYLHGGAEKFGNSISEVYSLNDPDSTGYYMGGDYNQDFGGHIGWQKDYENGSIIQTVRGTYAVFNDISDLYFGQEGGPNGSLGLPTSNSINIRDNIYVQNFTKGWIVHDPNGSFPPFIEYPDETVMALHQRGRMIETHRAAFVFDNRVFEAHRNLGHQYFDPSSNSYIDFVETDSFWSVHEGHTLGSFLHRSTSQVISLTESHLHIPVNPSRHPGDDPNEVVEVISQNIDSRKGDGIITDSQGLFLNCNGIKGSNGEFTKVSLLEWASERIYNLNATEGFIDDKAECLKVNLNALPSSIDVTSRAPLKLLLDEQDYAFFLADPGLFKLLVDSELFEDYIANRIDLLSDLWLKGLLKVDQFIMTDPLGRQLGYTDERGLFSEIPSAFLAKHEYPYLLYLNRPISDGEEILNSDLCIDGNTSYFERQEIRNQFSLLIPERIPGEYGFEFIGFNPDLQVALETEEGGALIEADECSDDDFVPLPQLPKPDDSTNPGDSEEPQSVPESGLVLGLSVIGTFIIRFVKPKF